MKAALNQELRIEDCTPDTLAFDHDRTRTLDPKLTRQHFSTRIYRAYLLYLRKHYPEIDLNELCASSGLPYSYVADEANWVSTLFDQRFTELCLQKTGDPQICYKVGKSVCSPEALGRVIYSLARFTISIQFIYREMA